ncbi:unnamed protein product [Auanema sp. JU1783]|nr:unnamed protein product [Auanema sp. JU1783]
MEKLDTELQLLFTEHRNLKEQIAATLLEKQNDLNSFELSSNNILQLVTRISEARKKVEKQLQGAQENLQETHSQLIKSQEHVAKLLQQVDFATKSNLERLDIQKEELEIETETVSHMRINLKKMEEEAAERTKNLETMTAELRWLKKQKLDFEMNERSNRILLKSLETERKSLIETLSLLLGYEMAVDEAEIKKKIRQLQKELENNKTVQIKLERDYQMIEEQLLDQAKQQRNALYRARTAEEEHCILEEKVESLLHEIKASELEIKEKEGKIEQFQAMFRKINSTIGLQTENGPKELIDRIEDLAIYESLLQKTRPNPTTLHKLASTTKPNVHSVAHAFCSKSPWERWDQRLFTAVTLESIKAADNEKLLLRKRLNEREKKIRELEKERKEVKSQKTSRNNEERVHAKPRTDDNKLKDTNVEALKNH